MLIKNKLFKYSVSTEEPHESYSRKETPEEIVRCPEREWEVDLNNNATWVKSDLL